MPIQLFDPHPALQRFIRHYIYCEIGSAGNWSQSSMAPPGYAKLAIVLQANQILARKSGGQARTFPPITFVGQVTHFIPFSWYGRLKVFFVIFRPCGAYPLIGIPQKEFKNLPVNFCDVMDASVNNLVDQLKSQSNPEVLKVITDRFFLRKISVSSNKQENIKLKSLKLAQAVKKMQSEHSANTSIKEICRQTGYSLRTFERHMKRIVGITPKQLERILRYNRAIQFISKSSSPLNWSGIAYHLGYYDQTHFIKEFKHFNGQTPSEYIQGNSHFLSDLKLNNSQSVNNL